MRATAARADHQVSLAASVTAFGLPGAPDIGAGPASPEAWTNLMGAVYTERIEGLLAAAVAGDALAIDDRYRPELRSAVLGRAHADLELERQLLNAAAVLATAGVSFRVLKGLAWAHSVYPDPSWRGSGDVDLLVGDDDWYRAIEVLEAAGARRVLPELRPGFDCRFGKDATLRVSGWELDLHRALVVGPFGLWVDQSELLARAASIEIGGVSLLALDPEASFIHACLNLVLGDDPPRLIAARDVAEMVLAGRADPDEVVSLAHRWRAVPVVVRAVSMAEAALAIQLWDQPVAGRFAATGIGPWPRALMSAYRGPGRGYSSQAAAVVALKGAGVRWAYLQALARPQQSYLQARGLSSMQHLRRGTYRLWRRP